MNKKVSIIIPIHNREHTIFKYSQLLLKQTYKNFEIIFIDNGSSDHSLNILRKIQESSPDKIRVYHQNFKSYGYTKNQGILHAVGDFITFLEPGINIPFNYIEKLFKFITKTDADMVVCSYENVQMDGKIINREILSNNSWSKFRNTHAWGRIIKTSFLQNNHLTFADTSFCEDFYFVLSSYNVSPKIITTNFMGCSHFIDIAIQKPKNFSQINPLPAFEHLLDSISMYNNISSLEVEFFIIKYLIMELTSFAAFVSKDELYELIYTYFDWLEFTFPDYYKNNLLTSGKIIDEKLAFRIFVPLIIRASLPNKRKLINIYKIFFNSYIF